LRGRVSGGRGGRAGGQDDAGRGGKGRQERHHGRRRRVQQPSAGTHVRGGPGGRRRDARVLARAGAVHRQRGHDRRRRLLPPAGRRAGAPFPQRRTGFEAKGRRRVFGAGERSRRRELMFRTHFRENGGRALVSDGRQRFEVDPEVEARQRKAAVRTSFFLLLLVFVIAAAAFWYLWNWRAQQLGADRPSFSLFGLSPSGSDASGDGAPGSGPDAVSAGGSVNVLLLGEDEEAVAAAFVAAFHP